MQIHKFEGNPVHPGSRGRNCAKGPATLNQITDPERILYPLRRAGKRGEGKWERVTWDEVLDDIGGRIRKALVEGRQKEVMYHLGRPGHELIYLQRVFHAWGIDGHNSHTNVCSASARAGYAFWHGLDRPSPDHSKARFILLLSSHLEAGHYFNPHAQRIIDGKMAGAKICVLDTRLSNTASMADYWLSPWPGTEAALLLAIAHCMLRDGTWDREFVRRWVNWEQYLREERPDLPVTMASFEEALKALYAEYTPEFAESESGVPAARIEEVAREVGRAGSALSTHVWRNAAAGNLHGWEVARALELVVVLAGAVATPGGTAPSGWNKAVPTPPMMPPPGKIWSELLMPREYPLAFFEMSFLLPHFLKEGRGKLAMYFTRVYNPVWTNPDGMSWIEMLTDEAKVERHACLTPTWSETAWFADYVLPMGHASERHDLMSQETHAARWIGFRQPVLRVALEKQGKRFDLTWQAHEAAGLGQVWEEDEFWIELSWRIDPDGALGIRKYFESPYRPGEKLRIEEFYRWIFEHSVPGLPAAAEREGLTPLAYMRKYGAFLVQENVYRTHESRPRGSRGRGGDPVAGREERDAVASSGRRVAGFPTPSRKLEFYSKTLKDWKWPEHAVPTYARSHVHWREMNRAAGEMALLPTFRLPTLIHSRSGNAKWLYEISHNNPLWLHPEDAARLGREDRRSPEGHDRDRALRGPGLGDRVDPAGRARVLASPRALAPRRADRRRALVHRAGDAREPAAGGVAPAPRARGAAVRERRSRLAARVVGGRGRAPEPDLPGAPGSGERPALLAPEGDGEPARAERPLRRRGGGHQQVLRGLSQVAGDGAARARARRPAPAALAAARVQARRLRVPHRVKPLTRTRSKASWEP